MRIAILTLALAAAALAADVAGKWTFHMETEGGPRSVPATFTVEGGKVAGKWGEFDAKGTFRDGKLELLFPVTSAEAGATAELRVTGALEGDAIKGTWRWSEHGGTFQARRAD
ncbi:MAG: hypothetical protein R2762_25065 [Bryobacteraceae bacterium]